jgi:hypothetical protein
MRTAHFWVIVLHVAVISYWHFGTNCRSHIQGSRIQKTPKDSWPPKMEPICCSETSLINYRYSLRNDQEELSSVLVCRSLLDITDDSVLWQLFKECKIHVWPVPVAARSTSADRFCAAFPCSSINISSYIAIEPCYSPIIWCYKKSVKICSENFNC